MSNPIPKPDTPPVGTQTPSPESKPFLHAGAPVIAETIGTPTRLTAYMPNEAPGAMIGQYRLLEVLGEGGFGTVWLAERREPFVQRVAIKILKAGMDTKAVIGRFEQERQALAVMDHPNVARVYDAGSTESGRPYFVMEHVAGEPITSYCDRKKLTLLQRLELFIPVCEAVQHAHQKGIIHRDLKPSNILVSARGEAGVDRAVPKVIDFGVAKAVTTTLTDKTIYTESGQLIGTPEYMAPEQADSGGADVDTRADVYSLGVVLYELLTGALPFESRALRGGGREDMRRVIRDVDPPKPSTRVTSLNVEEWTAIAVSRRADKESLASTLRRELDWIPLKAMRKDRADRYGSAADLARDVQRYIEGRPLEAGPESAAYRIRKIMRRNKAAVVGACAVAGALLLGAVGFAWQARITSIERDAAISARIAADSERKTAQAVSNFLKTLLQSSDPNKGGRGDTTVSEAMLAGIRELDTGAFREQPESEAALRLTIADILNGTGRSREALPLAEKALEITRGLYKGDHPSLVLALSGVGQVRETLGNARGAIPLHQEALDMSRRLHGDESPETARAMDNLAVALQSAGLTSDARPLYEESLRVRRHVFKGDHADVAAALNNYASSLKDAGHIAEAEHHYRDALAMYRRIHPGDHPDTAGAMNNVASIVRSQGRAAEAEPLFRESLQMQRRMFPGDQEAVAASINNLAMLMKEKGDSDEAERLYGEALAMLRRLYPDGHAAIAGSLNNLATLLRAGKRAGEAEPHYREALAMYRRYLPEGHAHTCNCMANLARCLADLGRMDEAVALAKEGAESAAQSLPEGNAIRRKCETTYADLAASAKK